MNKLKGIVFSFAFAFCAGSIVLTVPLTSHAATEDTSIRSRADVIEWRYKVENSKLYKRQYNYSKQVWVGDWIFVSNVIE